MKLGFFKILGLVSTLAEKLATAAQDGTITVAEGVEILEAICLELGIDLDKTGFNVNK